MRGDRKGLILRKGKVVEQVSAVHYLVQDMMSEQQIRMSLSGHLALSGMTLEIGQEVYIIVSEQDLTRGQLAVPGHRGGLEDFPEQKALLDAGRDPQAEKES